MQEPIILKNILICDIIKSIRRANIERVRNKNISSIYTHFLMVYTTIYGYYSKDDIEIEEHIRKEIQDTLNKAVEFSFHYYANFLLTYEDFSD